jgi:hypothetical protein
MISIHPKSEVAFLFARPVQSAPQKQRSSGRRRTMSLAARIQSPACAGDAPRNRKATPGKQKQRQPPEGSSASFGIPVDDLSQKREIRRT